eukprot:6183176-Pleurochrysis_carterae.AAC.2
MHAQNLSVGAFGSITRTRACGYALRRAHLEERHAIVGHSQHPALERRVLPMHNGGVSRVAQAATEAMQQRVDQRTLKLEEQSCQARASPYAPSQDLLA